MDGPNVNLSFIRDLQADHGSGNDPSSPLLLSLGTCGLHVMNNTFKSGSSVTGWEVVKFLRAAYNIF